MESSLFHIQVLHDAVDLDAALQTQQRLRVSVLMKGRDRRLPCIESLGGEKQKGVPFFSFLSPCSLPLEVWFVHYSTSSSLLHRVSESQSDRASAAKSKDAGGKKTAVPFVTG